MAPQQQQEDLDKKVESSESSASKVSDKTSREAESGKQDLVESAKKVIEALKAGGKSGITSDFGKPFLIEEGQQLTRDTAPKTYTSGEIPSIKGKITGEMKKPGVEAGTGGIGEGLQKFAEKVGEVLGGGIGQGANEGLQKIVEKVGEVLGGGIGGSIGEGGIAKIINEAGNEAGTGAVKMPGGEIQPMPGEIGPVKMPGGDIQPMPGEIGPVKMPGGELPPAIEFPQPGDKVKIPTGEYQPDAQPKPSIPQGEMQPGGSLPETYDTSARKDDATTKGGDSAVDAKERGGEKHEQKKADIEMEPMKIVGHYNGEEIHKDCDPTTHTVEKGDTLSKIAKEHLGPDATKEEIAKHVKEIARLSGIENPDKIKPGQELIIPGHTKDGGMVLEDNAGSKYTRWQDGTLRVENADQSGYVQKPAADGGYTEHHWGKYEDQNYELTKTGDGKYLVADSPCDVPEVADAGDPRVARAKLEETIGEKITNPEELAQFREDMRRFEERAREQHMSPEQVAKTYENLNRLINHEGDQPIPHDQKVHIAEDVINQAADPKTIDQGYHETCNVTTVESRAYTRDPAEASRIVADLATTGQVTYKDGTTVTMPANSMAPDGEASNHPAGYGDRSHASQLFQVAAVNSYYQTHPYTYTDAAGVVHNVPAGGMRYEQQAPIPGQNPQDTGERLVDTTNLDANGNPIPALDSSGNEVHSPDLTDQGIQEVNNRVTGEKGPDTYICHDDYVYGPKNGMDLVKSEQELNDHIAKLAKDGKLPVIIGVHSGNEPFLHDSGGGAAGGSGGGHVVTVTGYDPGPPAKVEIDNQWGEGNDHQGDRAVSVHDLYHAMRPPTNEKQLAEIQAEVVENRKPGGKEPDTFQEFEVLRLENKMPSTSANKISDAQFDKQMGEQMEAAAKRWKDHENPEDKAKAQEKLDDIISSLPPERRLKMLEKAHDTGMYDDKHYDEMMTDSIKAIRARYKREDAAGTGNAAERQKTRDQLKHMLEALPEDRRQDIIDNATS